MSLYKRVGLAGAMMFLFFPWAAAQTGDNKQQSDRPPQAQQRQQQQRRLAVLAQRLNLTDDQKQQWIRVQRETAQQVHAARQDNSLTEEQVQARLKEIHKQQRDQVLAILTPEQQESLKAFWEEQKQRQQPDKTSGNNSSSDSAAPDKESEKQDDLFAGMVSDDPVPVQPAQNKKTAPK